MFKNLIKRILKKLITILLYIFDLIIPKKNNCLLFGSRAGQQYGDNSRFLFEWIRENRPDLDVYYLTYDKKILVSEDKDERIIPYHSMNALKKLLRAKKIFITHGIGDMPYQSLCIRAHEIYYLGHGISFKRTDLATKGGIPKKTMKLKKHSRRLYAFISSGIERLALHTYFGIPYNQIKITGTPRNELLWKNIQNKNNDYPKLHNIFSFQNKIQKTILYAPTYLPEEENAFFSFDDFNLEKLKQFLEKNNLFLFLRMHRNDLQRYRKTNGDLLYDRIKLLDFDLIPDINSILHEFDILITDFSSIFFDYFLVDRPIIYITSKLEEYMEKIGFYFDYDNVTPGPKAKTFLEFIEALRECIVEPDKWKKERNLLTNLFHEYSKGDSCQKIMEYCLKKR
ncbi:MAG: CDP-glycerol glycerophosphotransferase family protein [Candidatus Heimdallarchaeota archaeon]